MHFRGTLCAFELISLLIFKVNNSFLPAPHACKADLLEHLQKTRSLIRTILLGRSGT